MPGHRIACNASGTQQPFRFHIDHGNPGFIIYRDNSLTRGLQHGAAFLQQLRDIRWLHTEHHLFDFPRQNHRSCGSKHGTGQQNRDNRPFILPDEQVNPFHGKAHDHYAHLGTSVIVHRDKGPQ
ncbi:hypothetical protein D3C75_711530 [compost metagenome]